MAILRAIVSPNASYIYHMLSVARCGYDNAYGRRFAPCHSVSSLEAMASYERFLSVSNDLFRNKLYDLMMAVPASSDDHPARLYYDALVDFYTTGSVSLSLKEYGDVIRDAFKPFGMDKDVGRCPIYSLDNYIRAEAICRIASIMRDDYELYMSKVFPHTRGALEEGAEALCAIFAAGDYARRWQKLTGYAPERERFSAVLCDSIEGGPQAISISPGRMVFSLPQDAMGSARLISHEYGMRTMRPHLNGLMDWSSAGHYMLFESLVAFFNEQVVGDDLCVWRGNDSYRAYYETLRHDDPSLAPREMFIRARDEFSGD